MSQDFMDPEIFADFIVEAKEHLEVIEPTLLELEKAPDNLTLLNDIFRPMHSLKGASGFLGLNRINSLAHKAEYILDELRNGSIQVTTEIMDVILEATDALRTMIDNLEGEGQEGDVETASIISHIETLLAGESLQVDAQAAVLEATGTDGRTAAEAATSFGDGEDDFNMPSFAPETYKLTVIAEGHLTDFLEEAREIVDSLSRSLVVLEKDPAGGGDLVNDIFRYFHNLKGNSGIIGYKELNALTHEAETLLNKVRKGEIETSDALIDLLLAGVDRLAEQINAIHPETGEVTTSDDRQLLARLRHAAETGVVVPLNDDGAAGSEDVEEAVRPDSGSAAPVELPPPAEPGAGFDPEDVQIFEQTVGQQLENIRIAFETLGTDSGNKDYIDGLYRSLVSVQNSCGYMGFEDIKTVAERTAGLVDQGRKADMDFSLMLDILSQECAILQDMVLEKLAEISGGATEEQGTAPEKEPEPLPEEPQSSSEEKVEPEAAVEVVVPQAEESAPVRKKEAKAEVQPKPKAAQKASPKAAEKSAGAAVQPKPKSSSTIRVDHEKLDHLMNLIGELIINRNRFAMLARSLEEGHIEVQEIAQSLVETTDSMNRISDDLQDTIMNVRMVPVGTVFSRFPRLVRDLSRKSGKQVELILEGEDTELDKSVVEVIGDPLVHMIRNSVDHGLEPAEDREAAGKNPVGKVWLRAYHKGNSVAIEVEDDGKGIDPEKMRQAAVKKGIITSEQAAQLDDREAVELIFAPGFSSAEKVTDISGRGVGMDVVRSNIKNLKGNVSVSSEVGKGSKISLTLPLTLAIIDALMVTVGSNTFAIPLDAVSETTKIEARRLTDVNSRKALELRGEVLGVVELSELLDLPANEEKREVLPVVIIQDNERRLGLVVDKLLERQEIVIKPLGAYLSDFDLSGVSGATIMGDGSVVLILDPHEIYGLAASSVRA